MTCGESRPDCVAAIRNKNPSDRLRSGSRFGLRSWACVLLLEDGAKRGSHHALCTRVRERQGRVPSRSVALVERTLDWLCRHRSLAKDFETRVDKAQANSNSP